MFILGYYRGGGGGGGGATQCHNDDACTNKKTSLRQRHDVAVFHASLCVS